jgi:hypothetical protein
MIKGYMTRVAEKSTHMSSIMVMEASLEIENMAVGLKIGT